MVYQLVSYLQEWQVDQTNYVSYEGYWSVYTREQGEVLHRHFQDREYGRQNYQRQIFILISDKEIQDTYSYLLLYSIKSNIIILAE